MKNEKIIDSQDNQEVELQEEKVQSEELSVEKVEVAEDTKKKEEPKATKTEPKQKSERILSIDRFRGLCMFAMVCSFILGIFAAFSPLAPVFEHFKPGSNNGAFQVLPGVSFADLFAPMFIFVIGLTMVSSFKKREEKYGTKRAYLQLATRFLALIGVGALLNGFENLWADVFLGKASFGAYPLNLQIHAICFWIAIALAINMIVASFVKNDKYKTISNYILRIFLAINGLLCLICMIACTGNALGHSETFKVDATWDTLQNIGLAGLMALPFVKFSKGGKLTMVIISFTAMTTFIQHGGFGFTSTYIEGGIIGGFGWACILLLGSIFAELKDDDKKYWVLTVLLLLTSVILTVAFNFTAAKRGCTPVYAMFASAVAAIIWGGLNCLNNWKPKFDFFALWGSNSIMTYITNYIVVALILGGLLETTVGALPIWAAIIIAVAILSAFTAANWYMRKKKVYIRI